MVCKGKDYNLTKAFSYLSKVSNEKKIQTKEILKNITKLSKENYLDIGSGAGDIFIDISKKFKNSVSIEPGDKMFSLLKENIKSLKNVNLEKITWNDFYIKYSKKYKNKFDLITSIHSIYFLKNIKKEIKNMLSLLKKDGLLIIICSDGFRKDKKDLKKDFVRYFRYKLLNESLDAKEYSLIKDYFPKAKVKKLNCTLKLANLDFLDKDHLSKFSEDTNYSLKFFFKRWWDEYSLKEKKEFKNYLKKYLSKDRKYYVITSKNQFIYLISK